MFERRLHSASTVRFLVPALSALIAIACGASSESTHHDVASADGGSSGSSGASSGDPFGDAGPGSSSGNSSGSSGNSDAACASAAADAELARVNLIVMFDKSGSMGNPADGANRALRWDPVTAAMKEFFSSPSSNGLSASLQYFPLEAPAGTQTLQEFRDAVCEPTAYRTPAVALQTLPSAAFGTSMDSMSPLGGTPTKGALEGAIGYAQDKLSAKPNEKAVVLLVTDGLPGGFLRLQNGQVVEMCLNNTVATVSASAQAAYGGTPPVSTYVIGIGDALANLQSIAAAGGTGNYIPVQVGNPAATRAQLAQALDTIRGQSIPCELNLPAPPDGQKMNIDTVNVVLTQNGAPSTLPYNKDCTGGAGWHYDDVNAPQKVILCANECTAAKSASSKVQVTFGCATAGGVVR